ncbi:MAG: hypothetical protein D6771_04970 [Zetaproteobacteria bacterium]|nr:MAG: hypothetical protein D6771_04970 [Zetaproteobacteria bacterium]
MRAMAWALLLAGCGYQIVGLEQGEIRALPPEVHAVALIAPQDTAKDWRDRLAAHGIAVDPEAATILRVQGPEVRWRPSAFDAQGLPVQYRIEVVGAVTIEHEGRSHWRSGAIAVSDDLTAQSPAQLEAEREAKTRELVRRWLEAAWSRVASGW